MKKIIAAALFSMTASIVMAKGAKEPSWISNPYSGYDDSQFIVATSNGFSFDDSDKKAIISVGNIIRQDIDAEEQVYQSSESTGKDLSSYLSNIHTSTDIKNITGLTIKDRYKTKKGECYSRAVLDKNAASKFYSIELNNNSADIESLIELAASNKSSFEACKNLMKAYKIALQNDDYIGLLSVLKPAAHHVLSYGSSSAVASKLQKALSDISIIINIAGDSDGRLAGAAGEAMNQFGISSSVAALSDKNSAYVFSADYTCEDIDKADDSKIYFCRSIISCTLTETATGQDIISFSRNSRQGKLSRSEARQAALRAAENALKEDFYAKFGSLFD